MEKNRHKNGSLYIAGQFVKNPQCGRGGFVNEKPKENKNDTPWDIEPLIRDIAVAVWGQDYYDFAAKSMYEYMYIRKVNVRMSNQQLRDSVNTWSAWRDIPQERKEAAVDLFLKFLYTKRPDIELEDKANEAQDKFINENAQQNESGGLTNDMTEDWGLVPGKPVFVKGYEGQHEYLGHLVSESGEPLGITRRGSLSVEGINGMVDEYIVKGHDTDMRIFLCLYGNETPREAPKGLKYRKS